MKRGYMFMLFAGLTLTLFGGLLLGGQNFLRQEIVAPLYFAAALIFRILRSLPQVACWWGMTLIGLAAAAYALRQARPPLRRRPVAMLPETSGFSRRQFWLNLFRSASADHAAAELRRCLLTVLAFQAHCEPRAVAELVRSGALIVPPEVRTFIAASPLGEGETSRRRQRSMPGTPAPEIAAVIDYLEERLGSKRDRDDV